MKKVFVALSAIALFFSACNQSEGFKLSGKIAGQKEGTVYLSKVQDNKLAKIDSATLKDGNFEFNGKVDAPQRYFIQLKDNQQAIQFFIENSNISIEADSAKLSEAKVTGSAEQDIYTAYLDSQKSFKEKNEALYKEYMAAAQQKNQAVMDSIRTVAMKMDEENNKASKEFIKANSNSVVAAFLAYRMASGMEMAEMEEFYNILGEKAKASLYGSKINERLAVLKKVAVGQAAPDFTLNTPEDQPFSLSSLKGKVVVIDFWASWCGPCRRENPHMVELYKELHEKGVEFLGVSLDKKKDAWLKAIADDGLVWNHVSDLQYWNSAAAKLYGINSIPATVLIDQNGVIAAKRVFGDDLKAEIEKLLQ